MNESERIAYLRQMGYQQYYSRYVLPGARESIIDSTALSPTEAPQPARAALRSSTDKSPQENANRAAGGTAESTSNKARAGSALSKAAEVEIPPRSAPRSDAATSSDAGSTELDTAASPQSTTQSLRFSLQFYRINDQLAVVNEAPHQLRGKDGKDAHMLLRNILLALGIDAQSAASLQADGFQWPIAEGIDTGSDPGHAAKLALEGFVSQRIEQESFANLLLLTAQLSGLMAGAGETQVMGDLQQENSAYRLTISHSLQSMLAHPELKREAWAHMQELRRRLNQL